jgi:hypothetical protein
MHPYFRPLAMMEIYRPGVLQQGEKKKKKKKKKDGERGR